MTETKKAKRTGRAAPARATGVARRIEISNVNVPGRKTRIKAEKYQAMRRALMAVLPRNSPGLTQAEMFKAVRSGLPEDLFPRGATANWWAKTVQLDLEAKKILTRENSKPLRWYHP